MPTDPPTPAGVPLFEVASNPTFPATRAEFRRLVGGMPMWEGGPPVPGWFKPGLWIRHQRTSQLWIVSTIGGGQFELKRPPGVPEDRVTCGFMDLHGLWYATDFIECDDCRQKPGSPVLCQDCLERRAQSSSGPTIGSCRLPKFCSRAYDGGWVPLEPQSTAGVPPPCPVPTRFEREDPL